jgi:signal transduction histidine kinase
VRIPAKLTVALIAAMALVLTLQGWLHRRQVFALQERETSHDLAMMAALLADATSEIWAAGGEDRARSYLDRADRARARTRIALVDGAAEPASTERSDAALVAHVPVEVAGQPRARLELYRTLEHEKEMRGALFWGQLRLTALLVLVSAGGITLLGAWLIGRPVERLIEQARRVARGDFAAPDVPRRGDELGRLAQELGSMSAELARTHKQLAEQRRARAALQDHLRHADRLSTVGKVASGIAHELGTPLNVVSGRAALISGDTDDPEIAKSARIIGEQAQRMTEIIRELLDFARSRVVSKKRAALSEVFEQAATLIEPLAEDRGVQIRSEVPAHLVAHLDVAKTLQVLTNLMMNAVQAMPEGGTLTVGARAERVEEPPDDHAEPGDYVALYVRDEGLGILADDLAQIFRPFFTTKRAGKGTGLGLYVCHGIVREQGGWIEVESEPKKGSCFTLHLPREEIGHEEANG